MGKLFEKLLTQIEHYDKIFQLYENTSFYKDLKIEKDKLNLLSLAQKVREIKLRMAFIGEFSSGKSTFLNAILQQNILPASFKPTTNQVMTIEHGDLNSVLIVDEPTSTLPLSQENIIQLACKTEKPLDIITSIPEPMDNFILYDTPGVNDPSALTEDIIFDMLGKSDIVIFLMRAENALKHTELDFLKSLVCQKDVSKFFFIINFADNISQKDAIEVQNHVVRTLSNALSWPKKDIEKRVILYSAKQSLQVIKKQNWGSSEWTRHTNVLNTFAMFAIQKREELNYDAIQYEIGAIVQICCQKLDAALDKIAGKDVEYKEQLHKINEEILNFRNLISENENKFRADIDKRTQKLKDGIGYEFDIIKSDVLKHIQIGEENQIKQPEWIQKFLHRNIEDKIDAQMKKFWNGLEDVYKDFDETISPALEASIKRIQGFHKGFNASPLLLGVGASGAVYMGITTTPLCKFVAPLKFQITL
nr:MAG: hypothetical protein B6I27_02315 [Erwiniaceae bacterium 4572_131]